MLNNNLKYCRQSLEMTQTELGNIFGVSKQTIANWENNNDIIPLKKLIKFCNMFNYSIDYVVGLKNKNQDFQKINTTPKIIGNNLKKLRKKIKLTQSDIAKECTISQTTYSNYELGINLITTLTLYTICKKHGILMEMILK